MRDIVVAVDVGTGSARAALFDAAGTCLGTAQREVAIEHRAGGRAEFDSEDIWDAVAHAVRDARAAAGVGAGRVAAIGFDATCSLVVRSGDGHPLPVSPDGADRWDTIAWYDHRAIAEAEACTTTGHPLVAINGGAMSPEMQVPKLMWLKRHMPGTWSRMGTAFDLADFLTWRASGQATRSICTLGAKWPYLPDAGGWQDDFLAAVGLADLRAAAALPDRPAALGTPVGTLTPAAAADLGLDTGCVVAPGMIDAFAGALGVVGRHADGSGGHAALVAGTSSCVMTISASHQPMRGVWGPYAGAVLPGYQVCEGGQSATGALLDHVIRMFGGGLQPAPDVHDRIIARIAELRAQADGDIAPGLHILPDFHGNRTPFSDARALGVISGLPLDGSFDALCRIYWRAAVAIALGLRQIVEHMAGNGVAIETMHLTGGHSRNPLLAELYADAAGCTLACPSTPHGVLLGSAMNAAAAAGLHADLPAACRAMAAGETLRRPHPGRRAYYEHDYRIFLRMQEQRRELAALG